MLKNKMLIKRKQDCDYYFAFNNFISSCGRSECLHCFLSFWYPFDSLMHQITLIFSTTKFRLFHQIVRSFLRFPQINIILSHSDYAEYT